MLLVEQNMTLALDLADRAYVLRTGEVSLGGDRAAELKADYEAVAAAYLGARPMSYRALHRPADHQRRQPRQPLCAGRHRPLHGLRHPAHDQLRPWRHDDGGCLRHPGARLARPALRLGRRSAASSIGALAGVVVERVAYRPVRGAPDVTLLLTSLAVTYILENLGILIFTSLAAQFSDARLAEQRLPASGRPDHLHPDQCADGRR